MLLFFVVVVSVFKLRKIHRRKSCFKKNVSEFYPPRAGSFEWGWIVQISVPWRIKCVRSAKHPGSKQAEGPMPGRTPQTRQANGCLWLEGAVLNQGEDRSSQARLRLKFWHSMVRGVPWDNASLCRTQRSMGAEWVYGMKPCVYSSKQAVLWRLWYDATGGRRIKKRKISKPWVPIWDPILRDPELSTTWKYRWITFKARNLPASTSRSKCLACCEVELTLVGSCITF